MLGYEYYVIIIFVTPHYFLPVWVKVFILFLILSAIFIRLIRLNNNRRKNHIIKFFIRLIWFFTQTFSILSNNIILSSDKSKLRFSRSQLMELILYGVIYSDSNKLNKYFDFIGNRYFLGSILILFFILIIV